MAFRIPHRRSIDPDLENSNETSSGNSRRVIVGRRARIATRIRKRKIQEALRIETIARFADGDTTA